MSSPKILVLSASVGAGHLRAAQALERALRELRPEARAEHVDILALAASAFRRLYSGGYEGLAQSAPSLLGILYEALDRPAVVGDAMRRFVQDWSLRQFPEFLRAGSWDAVVSTHFLPAEILAGMRLRGEATPPQAVVVTDFDAHRFWCQLPCERFFVPSEAAARSLMRWGAREESILVTGIPIDPAFARSCPRARARAALGIAPGKPLILQLSGGAGLGPVKSVFNSLLSVRTPIELVCVAGRNAGLRERLAKAPVPARHRVQVLGFTDRIAEWMAAADVLVSKPGGLTLSEALASGLAMVAVSPIPGQESRNCSFLLENRAGVCAESPADAGDLVQQLLSDRPRLASLRRKAAALGRPRAAFEAAEGVLELVLGRRGWALAEPARTPQHSLTSIQ